MKQINVIYHEEFNLIHVLVSKEGYEPKFFFLYIFLLYKR